MDLFRRVAAATSLSMKCCVLSIEIQSKELAGGGNAFELGSEAAGK